MIGRQTDIDTLTECERQKRRIGRQTDRFEGWARVTDRQKTD